MAALAYPITRIRPHVAPQAEQFGDEREIARVVRLPIERRKGARRRLFQRRVGVVLPAAVLLVSVWFGSGLIASLGATSSFQVLAGSIPTAGGYRYVVQPGDTVWSIASRLEPGRDPRALVDELVSRWHGADVHVGERVIVP